MEKIVAAIEKFAPPETAEPWDFAGWAVERGTDVKKIMLALTVTPDVVKQARDAGCDMIVSHHPLFFVPLEYADMPIYCAHTNLDRAQGGTTDSLIVSLGLKGTGEGFLRYVEINTTVADFEQKFKNVRTVNNRNVQNLKKIAFCAGSGSDFINEAAANGADALVTGDIKFHTALESGIVLFDVGHFESEIGVLKVFADLLPVETVFAHEKSPFINVNFC